MDFCIEQTTNDELLLLLTVTQLQLGIALALTIIQNLQQLAVAIPEWESLRFMMIENESTIMGNWEISSALHMASIRPHSSIANTTYTGL